MMMFSWSIGWYGDERTNTSKTLFGQLDYGTTDVKVNTVGKGLNVSCSRKPCNLLDTHTFSPLKLLWWASLILGTRAQKDNLFPAQLELSSLDGATGFVLNGEQGDTLSGSSVSSAGDVNGDGVDDILIGAPHASPGGKNGAGRSYVVFGKKRLGRSGSLELSSLDGQNGFVLNGENSGDSSGIAVSSVGDVNGDGIVDMIIGANHADPGGKLDAGKTYIVFGNKNIGSSGVIELSGLNGTNGFVLNGEKGGDTSGNFVSTAGDVNVDGIADIIIGAEYAAPSSLTDAGKAYVVFGNKNLGSSGVIELSNLDGTSGFVLNGQKSEDICGNSVSYAGDVNGDGFDDFLVGAPGTPTSNAYGDTYVMFGMQGIGSRGSFDFSSLNAVNGAYFIGFDDGDFSSNSVSSAGDVNGDGISDILIGAKYINPIGLSKAGETYVFFGKKGFGSERKYLSFGLNWVNGFRIVGENEYSASGHSVSDVGDLNGDGVDDLSIGAPTATFAGRSKAGRTYVVYGKMGLGNSGTFKLSRLNGDNGFIINGEQDDDRSGSSISSAGDVNGDGFNDMLIGAPSTNSTGKSYVIFGIGETNETSTLSSTQPISPFISQSISANQSTGAERSTASVIELTQPSSIPSAIAPSGSNTIFPSAIANGVTSDRKTTQTHTVGTNAQEPPFQSVPPSSSTPLYIAIAAAVAALVSGLLTGGFCYLNRRSERHSQNGGTPLDQVDSKHEYDSINILPRMRTSQSDNQHAPGQTDGNYDLIPAGKQQSTYTDLPSQQQPHDSKHYTSIDKVEKAHDDYIEEQMKKAHDYYSEI